MPSEQDIVNQLEPLALCRQNVQLLLRQVNAQGGWIHVPIGLLHALSENRRQIAWCKAVLRAWGIAVEDQPDDYLEPALDTLNQQIHELEQSVQLPLPETARTAIAQLLQNAQERRNALTSEQITVTASLSSERDVYIATQLTITNSSVQGFFQSRPPENGAALLDEYLDALGHECQRLRLSRLTGRRQTGADRDTSPELKLQTIYTTLTTSGPSVVLYRRERTAGWLRHLWGRLDHERTPDRVPPEQVRLVEVTCAEVLSPDLHSSVQLNPSMLEQYPPDKPCTLLITRPELVFEAIASQRRLVLLGDPGAGKSTVLRYLVLLLIDRLRDRKALPGWPTDDVPIPILCPLGRVAAALPEHKGNADRALSAVLNDLLEAEQGQHTGLREYLLPALRGEGVLLLFDGLDELPIETAGGGINARLAIIQAIRSLGHWTRARIVVTSRVVSYYARNDWQLPAEEGWQTRTLAPLAFGQVRTFVASWYAALAATGSDPDLHPDDAQAQAEMLIDQLATNPSLRPLTASPLLLTMLVILHYNTDEIPRDRARLYEECVQLLLERWEPVRTPGQRRPGLLEQLGNLPGLELDLLRGVIHDLAFQAHDHPPGGDGHSLLDGDALRGRLLRLFIGVHSPNPAHTVATFEQVLREDAGLLLMRADGQYAFPHLIFQEYLAACYIADRPDMVELAHKCWHSPDAERWREVLRLLVGRLRQQGKVEDKLIPWLPRLLAPRLGKQPKSTTMRRRDAVLAMLVYEELGMATLMSSAFDIEALIQKPLRAALLDLLSEEEPTISHADQMRARFLLAELGKPDSE